MEYTVVLIDNPAPLSVVNSHSEGGREFIDNIRELGLTEALSIRDAAFRDGRTITTRSHD